jgi:DNA-binding Lrp family transcriptional regulator
MAIGAYILIQTDFGRASEVAAACRGVRGVTEAEDVTGPYDVIVRAQAESVDDLGHLVVGGIQGIEGISRTLTCLIVNL